MPEPTSSNRATASAERDLAPHDARRAPMTEAAIRAATVGEPQPLVGPIVLKDYDRCWPALYEREADRLRQVLGQRAQRIEHVGSTAVPGLAAKPIVDLRLVVADSADEPAYLPAMTAAGYTLRIREPDWYEHRLFKGPDTDINLHVFSAGCPEINRMLRFRDWVRANPADRSLYERTKRALARQTWHYVQNYADAKTAIIAEIDERARRASGTL
jgi:GrpB-like predicted nucleotidyltransferase (UPF0157 family)